MIAVSIAQPARAVRALLARPSSSCSPVALDERGSSKPARSWQEGETTGDAYVVDRGRVRVQRQTPYGDYTLAALGPGELFGETAFVDRGARSGDALAEGPAELLVLSPAALGAITARARPALRGGALLGVLEEPGAQAAAHQRSARAVLLAGRRPRTVLPPPRRNPTGEFRVDIAAKRDLFQEQKLSGLEINFLSSLSREKKLASQRGAVPRGRGRRRMYVCSRGGCMISKYIPGAGEEALAFLERGDYFGEMALIDHQPRSADARAHDGGAVVLAIPREVVEGLLDVRKVSSLRLLKILCGLVAKRLRELDDKIVGWHILAGGGGADRAARGSAHSARARLAACLRCRG